MIEAPAEASPYDRILGLLEMNHPVILDGGVRMNLIAVAALRDLAGLGELEEVGA
jgi:hypothetical protein